MSSAVHQALRSAYPQALATLNRITGDLEMAQDGLHVAVERALLRWEGELPTEPVAWLVRAGRNTIIDQLRHRAMKERNDGALRHALDTDRAFDDDLLPSAFRDDMARLVFTCCDPRLKPDTAVMLTLHTVAGLSIDEIARAYLMKNSAVERRITRARQAVRELEGGYQPPTQAELPARLDAALAVFMVLFTEGYTARETAPFLRPQLCELAIRSTRILVRLFRSEAEVQGLLALMLLQHARAKARLVPPDRLVSLEYQDRTLWDHGMRGEGLALVQKALMRKRLGPYQIQAAIAAVHASAPDYQSTNWQELVLLYDALLRHRPNAVVRLNRTVAVSRARGPKVGLALLRELADEPSMSAYSPYFVVQGHLLAESGRSTEALAAFAQALTLCTSPLQRRHLERLLEELRTN
ncbi:MAG: sigma-70 family RNA polymerase sigma factor [Nannocystaceae bacterium]|nr:sigma-70 family RNA polymerase sigma factor [Nannocystaceae bacterium]